MGWKIFLSKASISLSRSQFPPMWTKKQFSSHTERMAAVSAFSRPFQNIWDCFKTCSFMMMPSFYWFMFLSQNATALSIQPSATVPVPSPKPWDRPGNTSIMAPVPFFWIAATRLSMVR